MILRYAILIPARDEADALGPLLEQVGAADPRPAAVVVVDNGSQDETADVARLAGAVVVSEPRPGYGRACRTGIEHLSRAEPPEALVFLDADDFAAPAQLGDLLRPIAEGRADLVIGERRSARRSGVRLHARWGNRLVLALMRGLYGSNVRDMGPFRAIRWSCLERLRLDDRNYGWYVQMQVRALRSGYRVLGVPVRFERRTVGRSKISGSTRASLAAGRIMLRTLATEAIRPGPDRVPYGGPATGRRRRPDPGR